MIISPPPFLQPHVEATVNPSTLVPIGDLSKELLNHLATSEDLNKKLKEEIESGKFEFKAKTQVRVPNPNYNPSEEGSRAKRPRRETFLSKVPASTMEKVNSKSYS